MAELSEQAQKEIRNRAEALGLSWEAGTPIEEIREGVRKKLRRYEDRKFSPTLYVAVPWGPGHLTLCMRYNYGQEHWECGWSWRNPTDHYSRKEGERYARERMRGGAALKYGGQRCNPPWRQLLMMVALSGGWSGDESRAPRWAGKVEDRVNEAYYALETLN